MKTLVLLIVCALWWAPPLACRALTMEEVLLLKQNGVSDATIQMMLGSEMRAQSLDSAGARAMGIETIIRPGGQPAIVYTTGASDPEARVTTPHRQEQQAWELLRHIIIDLRGRHDNDLKRDPPKRVRP
jgi:hypothetical protein